MKERPIIFSAPMVRAILEGRKTQTRRIVKFPDGLTTHDDWLEAHEIAPAEYVFWSGPKHVNPDFTRSVYKPGDGIICPYGQPGDRLWVREAWRTYSGLDEFSPKRIGEICMLNGYEAPWMPMQFEVDGDRINWNDYQYQPGRYRHARFMPRWASRILLEITDVRVERLMWLSEADAIAEGFRCGDWEPFGTPRETAVWAFSDMWEHLYGPGSWEQDPWVWVITFKRIEP